MKGFIHKIFCFFFHFSDARDTIFAEVSTDAQRSFNRAEAEMRRRSGKGMTSKIYYGLIPCLTLVTCTFFNVAG